MPTFIISDSVFNSYSSFWVRNREVTPSEAYAFVVEARAKRMQDFNIARMIKVSAGNATTNLLNALTN